jgi:hypothetical protein
MKSVNQPHFSLTHSHKESSNPESSAASFISQMIHHPDNHRPAIAEDDDDPEPN